MAHHAIFAQPLPDETLTSLIARIYQLQGCRSWHRLYADAFKTDRVCLISGVPSHLSSAAKFLDLGLTGEDLLHRLTLWNAVSAFMPMEARRRLCAYLLYGYEANSDGMSLAVLKARLSRPFVLCPACLVDDFREFGIAYWHRSHQLPLATYCWRHGVRVIEDPASRSTRAIPLPDPCRPTIDHPGTWVSKGAARYAQLAHDALNCNDPPDASLVPLIYQARLTEMGLVRGSRLRHREIASLCEWATTSFSAEARSRWPSNWLTDVLHGRSSNPVLHWILIASLFGGWREFREAYQNYRGSPVAPCIRAIRPIPSRDQLEFALAQPDATVRRVAKATGWSDTTVRIRARMFGLFVPARASRIPQRVLRSVAGDLKQGIEARRIAIRRHVSLSTVSRLRRSTPAVARHRRDVIEGREREKRRQALEDILAGSKSLRRAEVRLTNNSLYLWLLRHDSAWFNVKLPAMKNMRHGQLNGY